MEIKKFDSYRCSECDIEFFVPLNRDAFFCPFCGDENAVWQYEVEMVVD